MSRVYIAGPMCGLPHNNFPAFDAARDRFKALGWDVISPADLDRLYGFDGTGEWKQSSREIMARDIRALLFCEAIALLPDWEKSAGARAELMTALFCGLRVLDAKNGGELIVYVDSLGFPTSGFEVCARHER